MSVSEHVHDLPTDDELAQLIGAATPHFALQIRDRIAQVLAGLPADHPSASGLRAQVERLERLAAHGEHGAPGSAELPRRAPLLARA